MFGIRGTVAQRLEQGTHNPLVACSNHAGPIGFKFRTYRASKRIVTTASGRLHHYLPENLETPLVASATRG